jgi:F-box and WD-40 domain protein CDC4
MDPPLRPGGGRPSSRGLNGSRSLSKAALSNTPRVDPSTTLGQLAFAPAMQTTVVTTTTTTTTKFPPFAVRATRRTLGLNPKHYPLADTPTPAALRKITFSVNGKQAVFNEAEDANMILEQLDEELQMLQKSDGAIQTTQSFDPWTDIGSAAPSFSARQGNSIERPVSPESITEVDELEEHDEPSPSARSHRRNSLDEDGEPPRKQRKKGPVPSYFLRDTQAVKPLTPDAGPSRRKITLGRSGALTSPRLDQQRTPLSLLAHTGPAGSCKSSDAREYVASLEKGGQHMQTSHSRCGETHIHADGVVPTPPIDRDEMQSFSRPSSRRVATSIPSRLNVADSPVVQDGSLPSPSLSPVTAAANLHSAGYFADVDSNSETLSLHDQDVSENETMVVQVLKQGSELHRQGNSSLLQRRFAGSSITDIPAMLDYFEAIPDELKSYLMHQMLRRCPKTTLHIVADTVNPALKCDFLSELPLELGLNVVRFLDVQSLCKASQVSKKWREMINSDETSWKEIFDADGLKLSEDELQRAINEGWGWQDPYGLNGFEKDLGGYTSRPGSDGQLSAPQSTRRQSGPRRAKRKAAAALVRGRKQLKRSHTMRDADFDDVEMSTYLSSSEGPRAAAKAALRAVPDANLGLPSLKGMHLYKSLYRRHHLIRRNWMFEDTKPHHIAFRAHDSHVVTCLQFDTDKILTGSDDNNIHVYDTKTGALRAKLEGHEGGVWALQYEGNVLVSGSTDRSVRVWDIKEGIETHVFRGHTSTVRCLQILMPTKIGENAEGRSIMMPKQPLIITGSRDSNLRVWTLPRAGDTPFVQNEDDDVNPFFIRALTGHQHSVRAIAAHADTLVSGSYDCTVRVWKISTGETVHRLQGHIQKVYSVVLDNERNRCISGSMDNMVKIWSLDTGSLLHTLDGHSSLVGLLDLKSDRLVSAAADSTLRIWDPEQGQCKATLSAHTGAITCFQHDGYKVISGSDRTLKMWNVRNGEFMKDLMSDLSGVWQVKFNERRCVAAVQRDNMTYLEVSLRVKEVLTTLVLTFSLGP